VPDIAPSTSTAAPRIPWWLWPNVLSLDAPLVAVIWQAALAKVHKVALLPALSITLFIAVWLIYIVDRVLDGFSMRHAPRVATRHAFYQRNRWLYLLFVIPVASVLLMLLALTAIPEALMWRGLGLGFIVGLYLLHYAARGHRGIFIAGNLAMCGVASLVVWVLPLPPLWKVLYGAVLLAMLLHAFSPNPNHGMRLLPKELLCGFIFAVGCSMSVSFMAGDMPGEWFSRDSLMLALLCALNCIAISCYERDTDACSDPHAITRTWPRIVRVYPALLVAVAVFAVSSVWGRRFSVEFLLYPAAVVLSTILLAIVHHFAKRITPDLAHVLADAAVVAPMALIVMAH
jgi:hypothetical protein